MTDEIDELKRRVGEIAAGYIQSGMVVGLGSGSTAFHFIRALGKRWHEGQLHNIVGIPCSEFSVEVARPFAIPLGSLNDHPIIDITVDGADEIDPNLNLIKGLGGAHLREKIVAMASKRMIVIADDRKLVDRLGTRAPVPVEVIQFAGKPLFAFLESLGARPVLREMEGQTFITDEGNIIYDCYFEAIHDPADLDLTIKSRPGVVEHGLFLNLATEAIVATATGIKHFQKA